MLKNLYQPLLAVCAVRCLARQQHLPVVATRLGLRAGRSYQRQPGGKKFFASPANAHASCQELRVRLDRLRAAALPPKKRHLTAEVRAERTNGFSNVVGIGIATYINRVNFTPSYDLSNPR